MAIGSINSKGSWYSLGGRPLGVQLGQKSASSLFGNRDATSIIAANVTASAGSVGVSNTQILTKGLQDEIDRTQGFRTDLTVAEKQQLAEYQDKITEIEQKAGTRALTDSELADRADYYARSYEILGKEYPDVSDDSFVKDKLAEIDDLLAKKPKGAEAKRLERLQNIASTLKDQINAAGEKGASVTTATRLISVKKQIYELTAPRKISALSTEERSQYDDLVTQINDHLGLEYQLPSAKRLKIERLQKTIETVSAGGGGATNILA